MYTTSLSLLERLRRPEQESAWVRFVDLYSPLLFYWGKQMGQHDQDAADFVQDVFTHLVTRLPRFEYNNDGSFRAWLRTVAMNVLKSRLRRRRLSDGRAPLASIDELADEQKTADEKFWEQEYQQHVLREALRIAQSDFASRTWQACWRVIGEGRSAPEVARELGMTVGAVYAARIRVLTRLREELRGMLE